LRRHAVAREALVHRDRRAARQSHTARPRGCEAQLLGLHRAAGAPRAGVAASALAAEGVPARPFLDGGMDDWQARGNAVTAFRRCGGSG